MKTKIFGILVCMLLMATTITTAVSMINDTSCSISENGTAGKNTMTLEPWCTVPGTLIDTSGQPVDNAIKANPQLLCDADFCNVSGNYCNVSGIVVDESSGEPLEGVDVSKVCPPYEYLYATTNSTGNFTFETVNGIVFKLSFKTKGYRPVYTTLSVPGGLEEYDMGTIYMTERIDVQLNSHFQSLFSLLRFALAN